MTKTELVHFLNKDQDNQDLIFGLCIACPVGEYVDNCPFLKIRNNTKDNKSALLLEIEKISQDDQSKIVAYHFFGCSNNNASIH